MPENSLTVPDHESHEVMDVDAVDRFSEEMQALLKGADSSGFPHTNPQELEQHGLAHLDPTILPRLSLRELSEDDWLAITEHRQPFLKIWSVSNRIHAESAMSRVTKLRNSGLAKNTYQPSNPRHLVSEEVCFQTLPLTHGTGYDELNEIMRTGHFKTSADKLTEGVDDEWGGKTYADDRTMGLDGFTFTNFGRPRSNYVHDGQMDATIVLNPETIALPGVLITQDEFMEEVFKATVDKKPDQSVDSNAAWHYMQSFCFYEDFMPIALNAIFSADLGMHNFARGYDGRHDNLGLPSVVPWEVKLPGGTPASRISRVVFRSEELAQRFLAEHPDTSIVCTVEPDIQNALLRGHDVFGAQAAYDIAFKVAEATDQRLQPMVYPEGYNAFKAYLDEHV